MIIAALSACGPIGFLAYVAEKEKIVTVPPVYAGLANSRVAVMVAADERTQYMYPTAIEAACRTVTGEIGAHVEGVMLAEPDRVVAFQRANGAWIATPPATLLQRLDVDHIVVIDLVEYATHDEGNRHLWRGTINATVEVIAAEAPDRNNAVLRKTFQYVYPEGHAVGTINGDDATIQAGLLGGFSMRVGKLFYEHQERANP